MDAVELRFEPSSGLWLNSDGRKFIRNEFNPDHPVWIDVSTDVWTYSFGGSAGRMDWLEPKLPRKLIVDFQFLARESLRTKAPTWTQNLRRAITALGSLSRARNIDLTRGLGGVTIAQWALIWDDASFEVRTMLRFFYREMAVASMQGARHEIALELDDWIAWPQPEGMRDVLTWNDERGAYTSAEVELLRRELSKSSNGDSPSKEMARVYGWMLFETYKRPSQLLGMTKDALVSIPGERPQYFLRIPKVKAQTGESTDIWPISAALAKAISDVSLRSVIRELQGHFNRLIVLPGRKRATGKSRTTWDDEEYGLEVSVEWHKHGRVPSGRMVSALDAINDTAALSSPRTGRSLRLGAKRIRHTGGTSLAMQGAPIEDIQTILEHDDPSSAQAYIDAVASELIPAIERADRALGGLFAGLNSAFFNGSIVSDVGSKQIYVPDFTGIPAVVGSCGSGAACPTNPFWACYGGCPNFQAWKDADHHRSLNLVEREHRRWSAAEAGKERSKLGKDFERIFAGISDVIHAIEKQRK